MKVIDREARNRLGETIESYLDDRLMAFTFDDQIMAISGQTQDETVRIVVQQLWFFYDDCTNHRVVLSKEAWDYIQRLLLLLDSDAELLSEKHRRWTWKQTFAVTALSIFMAIAFMSGLGVHLYILAIPFGLISMILSAVEAKAQAKDPNADRIVRLTPFKNLTQLLVLRRRSRRFRKRRYRLELVDRLIRSPASDRINQWQGWIMWLLFSPFVLFAQAIPRSESNVHILMPAHPATKFNP